MDFDKWAKTFTVWIRELTKVYTANSFSLILHLCSFAMRQLDADCLTIKAFRVPSQCLQHFRLQIRNEKLLPAGNQFLAVIEPLSDISRPLRRKSVAIIHPDLCDSVRGCCTA